MRSPLALLLVLFALPFTVAACGDDDDDGGGGGSDTQVLEFEANEQGVTGPESAEAGAVEIRFSNTGKKEHSAQIVEIGDGHTPDEALKAGEAWGEKGKPLPEWVSFRGGVGTTKPGKQGTAIVELTPGEYAVFDIDSDADEAYMAFTVEGEGGGDLPEAAATVEALEYEFKATDVSAGPQKVLFENTGSEPHHMVAAPLKPGATQADVQKWIKSEGEGKLPFEEKTAVDTAIVSGGESAVLELTFASGDHVFLCFIPDRKGGPPHVAKGMATTGSVD